MSSGKKRNIQLDALRGIAILLVMGRHLEIPRPGGAIGAIADAWFTIGWLGVDLFFVLSGFLIGGLLLMELDKHGTIAVPRFLIRRGLKIYPLYIVFMGYLMAMPMAKAMIGGADVWAALSDRLRTLWPNLLFINNYVGTNPEGHTWSLAVEEHFYLTLPFVLVLLARAGLIRLLIPLCLSSLVVCLTLRCASVWSNDSFASTVSATHLRIDALLSGVAIRALAQYYPESFMSVRQWRGALVVVGVILWSQNFFYETGTPFFRTVGLSGTNLGAAAFLLAAYHTHANDFGRWSNMISQVASMVAWIGLYSYGIYLWHVTVIGILTREFGERIIAWSGGTTQPVWLVNLMVIGGGAILVGAVLSKVVEWPVLRMRDRLFPSRTGSLPPAARNAQAVGETAPLASVPSE